jgi:FMN-dependent oxidoreductase (nitrilotriacetate monooxygenase family)
MAARRELILTAALMHGLGAEHGAWRVRAGAASDYVSPAYYTDMAQAAERGKLQALFLAEQMTNRDTGTNRPCGAMDTATVLSFMAAVTSRLGLVGTGSTTYNQPYDLARRFSTLDQLAQGRIGWNSVTTANASTARMFGGSGIDEHPDALDRYARADEFLEVVTELWASWDDGALVGDKASGVFADPSRIHEIGYRGKFFDVLGPAPFPPSAQGRPVIFHAGSSPAGRDQAARCADVVFTSQHTEEGAAEFRNDIRRRAAAYGRNPELVKILPGIQVMLGGTMEEAEAKKRRVLESTPLEEQVKKISKRIGLAADIVEDNLDSQIPYDLLIPDEDYKGGIGWRRSTLNLAEKENLTIRELIYRAPSPHHHVIGTPETVADAMEQRAAGSGVEGFTMMVAVLPEGLLDIVDGLVPELQKRGLFHDDYEHATLRESLGLAVPQPLPQRDQR